MTGGVVVRDPALPALAGRYVYGDFCRGQVRSFRIAGGKATGDRALGLHVVVSSARSARTPAAASTSTSLDGPVYRLRVR